MSKRRTEGWSRREFLGLTLAGTAGLLGLKPEPLAAEPPPETTTLRLAQTNGDLCMAPQYVAEQLLRDEGFTDVQYIKKDGVGGHGVILASGEADISMVLAPTALIQLDVDAGNRVVILAGGHIGCFELFGSDRVRTVRDLKGKTVAVPDLRVGGITFMASIAAYVGLAYEDINWVTYSPAESAQLLTEGKIDAFLLSPPELQELRTKHNGHVIVNGTLDRPWSQYFCCLVAGNREFVRKHPVATKRTVRAILKATDFCGRDPERAARILVDKGYTNTYEHILQGLKEIPYGKWREYNPEDTVRFYALRLHESGMIKSTPQKIIAEGTDWRFWHELKEELKG